MYLWGNHDLSFDSLHTNPFHFVGFEIRLGSFPCKIGAHRCVVYTLLVAFKSKDLVLPLVWR